MPGDSQRCSVVHHIDRILAHAELFGQLVHDVGVIFKRVGVAVVIRHAALPEARVVGRD